MTYLDWSHQSRTKIENVPPSVIVFFCQSNQIRTIENLPAGLIQFYYYDNPIKHVDNIPITWWNERGGFKLHHYNLLKRLQRRIRIRIRIKHNKARIIQNGCHNWLWKTECRDGTMGIVLRLSLRDLTQAGLIKD